MLTTTVEASQCARCGRKLRSKKAMEDGIGRVCKSKAATEQALQKAVQEVKEFAKLHEKVI